MAPQVQVRASTEADLSWITALYAAQVEHGAATYEYTAPGVDEMARRWRAVRAAGHAHLVAEVDGRLAGYAYASAYRAREGYSWTVEDSVYVDDAMQRRGIGHALLSRLVEDCTRRGFRQMVAVIGDASNIASRHLHERHGFAVSALFPGLGFKHGRWLDNLQMQRALGDGSTSPPSPILPAHG